MMKGLSDNYLPVLFSSAREIKNEMLPVRIDSVKNMTILGSVTPIS